MGAAWLACRGNNSYHASLQADMPYMSDSTAAGSVSTCRPAAATYSLAVPPLCSTRT
jgi:hypothetical protein